MSLVDYASSSEDDDDIDPKDKEEEEEEEEEEKASAATTTTTTTTTAAAEEEPNDRKEDHPSTTATLDSHNQSLSSSYQQSGGYSHSSITNVEKLPDASLLLNSPTFSSHQVSANDHTSRVTAAMAESASRKREFNVSASSFPHGKYPKGNLPSSRNVPKSAGGALVPPQLSGRSNVVTEDMGKLFVKKATNLSSH